ncbi:hypothetical protein [Cryobacterium sp. M96]|uniref:hypothetical protein n=1 Tax=Cryobacterium sp. M96 TaxID=2048295 RepID=UPI0011B09071|nr:hypothetical protein [Cryobacterium sp. M96]
MDLDAVNNTVGDVLDAMLATDPREHRLPRGFGWPAGACEDASAVVAAILEDRRLGRWIFVTAGRPDGEPDGHAWLEWRAADGGLLYSIDSTIHQFAGWSEPFIGEGQTPAAAIFSVVRWEGAIWDWPDLGPPDMPLPRLITAVREQLGCDHSE